MNVPIKGMISSKPKAAGGKIGFLLVDADHRPVSCLSSLRFEQDVVLETGDQVILTGAFRERTFHFDTASVIG